MYVKIFAKCVVSWLKFILRKSLEYERMDQEEEQGDFQLTRNPSHENVDQSQPIDAAQEEQHRHVEGRLQEMDLQDEGSQPVAITEYEGSQQLALAREEVAQIVRELASSGVAAGTFHLTYAPQFVQHTQNQDNRRNMNFENVGGDVHNPGGEIYGNVGQPGEPTIQRTPQNIAEQPDPSNTAEQEPTIQRTPQNIAEQPGPSQAPVQEPTIHGTPQTIAEQPGPIIAPVQSAAQPEPPRQRHHQDRETGGWHETIRQTEIKAFGFTIKGISAITLVGGATIAVMASLRDPVAREKLASAFVPFAAGAAGGAAASIFVTKYGQGSLLVEVVTKGSEAEANLLQAYSSGKIKQDLIDNHWQKAGDNLTVELTSYKVIRASEEEFDEIRKEVESLKDRHFQQNETEIILSSSSTLRDESKVVTHLSASETKKLVVEKEHGKFVIMLSSRETTELKTKEMKLSPPKEVDIPFSSILKMDSSKQKKYQKLSRTPQQFGSEDFQHREIIPILEKYQYGYHGGHEVLELLRVYEQILQINDEQLTTYVAELTEGLAAHQECSTDEQLTTNAAELFPENLDLSNIKLTESQIDSFLFILTKVEKRIKSLDLISCFSKPEDVGRLFEAIQAMPGKIRVLYIGDNIIPKIPPKSFFNKIEVRLLMFNCFPDDDATEGKRVANQSEIAEIQRVLDQLDDSLEVWVGLDLGRRDGKFVELRSRK
ncbi:uncharacterized protein LOC143470250 isoform X2 [Clavelina lepadiformis]|uniref:uncharacterized protein LOC143470250 isoform X2 n=1 Tax=Clavelina lepadiformis TaxID=159417 RepID=UPI0040431274